MRDEFKIQRQGKTYVLFSGLLDEAHERGLRSISTDLIQTPDDGNGNVAIVKAVVEMEDGRKFSGLGDASPDNVGRNIVPHLLRMAETRSKARALRDAVNVGITALEELGDDGESSTTNQPTGDRERANNAAQGASHEAAPERTPGGATVKAADYLESLVSKKYRGDFGKFRDEAGNSLHNLSAKEVKRWIEALK